MNTFTNLTTTLIIALGLTTAACQKTESEKAQDQAKQTQTTQADADKAVTDLANAAAPLKTSPAPTEKWTADELKAYEEKVKSAENRLILVHSFEGKNGVQVATKPSVEEARVTIMNAKINLESVRAKQAEMAAEQSQDARVNELKAAYDKDSNFVEGEGIPTQSWSEEKLIQYEAALNRIDNTLQQLRTTDGDGLSTKARQVLNDTRRKILTEARKK